MWWSPSQDFKFLYFGLSKNPNALSVYNINIAANKRKRNCKKILVFQLIDITLQSLLYQRQIIPEPASIFKKGDSHASEQFSDLYNKVLNEISCQKISLHISHTLWGKSGARVPRPKPAKIEKKQRSKKIKKQKSGAFDISSKNWMTFRIFRRKKI